MTHRRILTDEAVDIYTAEIKELQSKVRALKQQVLTHDKKEASLLRAARSATEDADVLLEAVSVLADSISNTNREGRRVRAAARKLLETRGIKPPYSLGSSRNRQGARTTKKTLDE